MTEHHKVRSIRNRLFLLLLSAFAVVTPLSILLVLVTTGLVLGNPSRENPLYSLPIISRLESYYIARGSWMGVSQVISPSLDMESAMWHDATLLDANGHAIVLQGREIPAGSGVIYHQDPNASVIPIEVKGTTVGTLIVGRNVMPLQRQFTFRFLRPVAIVAGFLVLFALLMSYLLTRRVVAPLSEVIAAAEDIAGGNLATRVQVQGPDDMRALSDSFNQMADSLEKNDRERRDLLADIAHELRTPLSVLRGRLEGIVDGVYPTDEKHIFPALEETYLLERLVEDLRLLTMAEGRQIVFEKRSLDINELARHVIDLFRPEADENQVQLTLQSELPQAVALLDPQRTEQVLGNLVNNALLYSSPGGQVWIETRQVDGLIYVSVNDNGPGIPEADLPFIFNRFWRGDRSRSRASGGAGLGLAIARNLIEAQGGSITARNREAGGLQVECKFPKTTG
jgi:signal transduction histidine kinase